MTFLSQFPRADAPPKGHVSHVDPEPVVGRDTHFSVEVEREGIEPAVRIVDSDGEEVEIKVRMVDDTNRRFDIEYTPKKIGKHEVSEESEKKSVRNHV